MDGKKLAERATGDVDESLLEGSGTGSILSSGYFGDGLLLDHLHSEEQLEYALQNLSKGLIVDTDEIDEKITSDPKLRTALLVTDERLLFVIGKGDGDETFSIPLVDCIDVEVSTGFLKNKISVKTESGIYEMYVRRGPNIEAIAEYIERAAPPTSELSDGAVPSQALSNGDSAWKGSASESSEDKGENQESTDSQSAGETSVGQASTEATRSNGKPESGRSDPQTQWQAERDSRVSQTAEVTIEVLVTDPDGDPIEGANVDLSGGTFGATRQTSQTGRCEIKLPMMTTTVDFAIAHPEYESTDAKVPVSDGAVIDVALTPSEHSEETDSSGGEPSGAPSEPSGRKTEVAPKRLLAELTDLNESTSRPVTKEAMRTEGQFDPEAYEEVFGTWSAAIDEASLNQPQTEEASTTASQTGDGDDEPEPNSPESPTAAETEFDWGSPVEETPAGNLAEVPEGRLSDVCIIVLKELQTDKNRREAVFKVQTASGRRLDLTIWKKHDVDFEAQEGDILLLDEVRLKRWNKDDGAAHELSSTKDISITLLENEQSSDDTRSSDGTDGQDQGESGQEQLIGLCGATENEAKALVQAGYYTKDDLKAASLDTLRSVDGLDDGTALRMKAEFG